MIYTELDNEFDWLGLVWFCTSNNCGVWMNGVEQNRETDRKHDEDCLQKGVSVD